VTQPDQLTPHSIEAEEAVLGSILINPDAIYTVIDFLLPTDFFIMRHAWVYEAARRLEKRGDPIDHLTLVTELESVGHLAEIGGSAWVLALINKTPSALNVEGYGRIIERMALRRRLVDAAGQIARVAHSEETEIDAVCSEAEKAVIDATARGRARRALDAPTLASEDYDRLMRLMRNPDETVGIRSYLTDLDEIVGSFTPGDVHYIAGRPGMGKTGLALTIYLENLRRGHICGFFSLEMLASVLWQRLIAQLARLDTKKLQQGRLTNGELPKYMEAMSWLSTQTVLILDTPNMSVMDIRAQARQWVHQHHIEAVFVDYLQLVSAGVGFQGDRPAAIGHVSRMLKLASMELEIPFIVVAQLNRECEQRNDKRPLLADFKGSGDPEQDATTAIMLYRDEYYDENADPNIAEAIVRKQRQGKTGSIELYFDPPSVRFGSLKR
jgi:replicative DNA helicase